MGGKVGLTPLADDATAAMESQVTNERNLSARGGLQQEQVFRVSWLGLGCLPAWIECGEIGLAVVSACCSARLLRHGWWWEHIFLSTFYRTFFRGDLRMLPVCRPVNEGQKCSKKAPPRRLKLI